MFHHVRRLVLATLACSCALHALDTHELDLDLAGGSSHRFLGFGASMVNGSGAHQQLSHDERRRLADLLWDDANLRVMRLWFHLDEYSPGGDGEGALNRFKHRYVDSGIIEHAHSARAERQHPLLLLLSPSHFPAHMQDQVATRKYRLKHEMAHSYAVLLADAIDRMQKELGVHIDATGIQNEPNDRSIIDPPTMIAAIKALRAELDVRGLQKVAIISPETASIDGVWFDHAEAIAADAEASDIIAGLAGHSYNMALTNRAFDAIRANGKPYWTTETGENGPESVQDQLAAGGLAARALNDIALGCSYWVWFIGAEIRDDRDDRTRLIRWHPENGGTRIETLLKYDYLKLIADALPIGTEILPFKRHSLIKDWSYGRKGRAYAVAGQRPDGDRVYLVHNYSSDTFSASSGSDFHSQNSGEPAARLVMRLPAPAGHSRASLRRAPRPGGSVHSETVEVHNGEVRVTLEPLDLVTVVFDR